MYVAVVLNSHSMAHAKLRYKKNKYDSIRWEIGEDMPVSDVIERSIREALVFKDTYTPKIFIVKD